MILQPVKYYSDWLTEENHKSFYLAFLRVALSLWLLKEICINWNSFDVLYSPSTFVVLKNNLINRLPGGLAFVRGHYRWIIAFYIFIIFLNIFGIGRWFTGLLLFLVVDFLQKMNMSFVNGGDYMAKLILLYLIFADSYKYFVLTKQRNVGSDERKFTNLLSNLAAVSIMLQLCVAYFSSGIAKISEPLWQNGEATYYALSMERFMGTAFNKYIAQYKWVDYFTNFSTICFELLFPFLIWVKNWRKPLLIAGVLFHLCIYIFLMIYGFQIVFVLIYGMFLPNEKLLYFSRECKAFFFGKRSEVIDFV